MIFFLVVLISFYILSFLLQKITDKLTANEMEDNCDSIESCEPEFAVILYLRIAFFLHFFKRYSFHRRSRKHLPLWFPSLGWRDCIQNQTQGVLPQQYTKSHSQRLHALKFLHVKLLKQLWHSYSSDLFGHVGSYGAPNMKKSSSKLEENSQTRRVLII